MAVVTQTCPANASDPVPFQVTPGSVQKSDWNLLTIPPEITLRIRAFQTHDVPDSSLNIRLKVAYLDIPDLASLSRASPQLAPLTSDPILHRDRLRFTAPSRVAHSLFGTSADGSFLRPNVGELLQRGIMRGFGIERQWRSGGYFYSQRVCDRLPRRSPLRRSNSRRVTDDFRLREGAQTAPSSRSESHFRRPSTPFPVLEHNRAFASTSR